MNITPNPAANVVLGSLLGPLPGVDIAFPFCQGSAGERVVLFTVTAMNLGDTSPRTLRVQAHAQPSNPSFNCPLIVHCDEPVYTMECAGGGTFYLDTTTAGGFDTPISNPQPPDGAEDVGLNPRLTFAPGVPRCCVCCSASYRLYFGTAQDPPLWGEPGFDPPFVPGPLQPGTTYYWRVSQSQGCASGIGPLWRFTTTHLVGAEPQSWSGVKSLFR